MLDLIGAHGGPGTHLRIRYLRIRYLRIAAKGGAEGGTFVTLQAALGTLVPVEAADAARATLAAVDLSRRRVSGELRVLAAETLCRVGDERGIEALRAMAEDPKQLDVLDQWHIPDRLQAVPRVFAPITPYEAEAIQRDSSRDTKSEPEAVMRDPTLPEADVGRSPGCGRPSAPSSARTRVHGSAGRSPGPAAGARRGPEADPARSTAHGRAASTMSFAVGSVAFLRS
ncbi:hypothetical protein [Streptomyces fuscichromogenes]|uniref:hypothetical protein n=1 Tax=Streptomyces fuscichromogenes TaxID=1324013 RepID=UPI00167090B6|nr:hypothetical protein [Streptomyces fuscichromogenes]